MNQPEEKANRIEAEIGEAAFANLRRQIEADVERAAAGLTTASAWIDQ